jgi:hypothetical protein
VRSVCVRPRNHAPPAGDDTILVRDELILVRDEMILVRNDLVLVRDEMILVRNDLVLVRDEVVLVRNDLVVVRDEVVPVRNDLVLVQNDLVLVENPLVDPQHARSAVQSSVTSRLEGLVGVDLVEMQALAESVGMKLHKFTPRQRLQRGVKPGASPGSLVCTAPSTRARDTNEWQYSTDGKTWIPLGGTRKAIMLATGLPIGVPLQVRHRQLTKDGYTDWSDPPFPVTLK